MPVFSNKRFFCRLNCMLISIELTIIVHYFSGPKLQARNPNGAFLLVPCAQLQAKCTNVNQSYEIYKCHEKLHQKYNKHIFAIEYHA